MRVVGGMMVTPSRRTATVSVPTFVVTLLALTAWGSGNVVFICDGRNSGNRALSKGPISPTNRGPTLDEAAVAAIVE